MADLTAKLPLELAGYYIRDYDESDIEGLCRLGSNDQVWRHLADGFPHPYTREDAQAWLEKLAAQDPRTHFAIGGPDGFCGGIGARLLDDPCTAHDAEIGFWLGRPHWNRGSARPPSVHSPPGRARPSGYTACRPGLRHEPRVRRVLRKCGYQHEGTLRLAVRKEGRYVDLLLFGHLPQDGLTEKC